MPASGAWTWTSAGTDLMKTRAPCWSYPLSAVHTGKTDGVMLTASLKGAVMLQTVFENSWPLAVPSSILSGA